VKQLGPAAHSDPPLELNFKKKPHQVQATANQLHGRLARHCMALGGATLALTFGSLVPASLVRRAISATSAPTPPFAADMRRREAWRSSSSASAGANKVGRHNSGKMQLRMWSWQGRCGKEMSQGLLKMAVMLMASMMRTQVVVMLSLCR